jgi:hypothetical protein
MKDVASIFIITFITWIVFQLVLIGMAYGEILSSVGDGTFNCEGREPKFETPPYVSGIFPLLYFSNIDAIERVTREYCIKNSEAS